MNSNNNNDNKNTTTEKPLIILTAGGTGGHVYPAEALAQELKARGYRLALVTDKRGKNNYHGALGEMPNFSVLSGALVGKDILFKLQSACKLALGILQSMYIIWKEKPACVIGFGGYASFPCAFAAALMGKELIIHEQNSVMSRTNRFLSKYASMIAESFSQTKYAPSNIKTVLTGMPVSENILKLHENDYRRLPQDKFQLLILGGSQGAKIFSSVLPNAIAHLDKEKQQKLKIYQQCRADDIEDLNAAYKGCELDITISPFFADMAQIYAGTHLIISRAGASSVSEIEAAGIPAILVPLPTAADDHQTGNAMDLAKENGCILVKQEHFTAMDMSKLISELMDDGERRTALSENAKKAAKTDAAIRFADAIEELIKQPKEQAGSNV